MVLLVSPIGYKVKRRSGVECIFEQCSHLENRAVVTVVRLRRFDMQEDAEFE